MRGLRRSGRRRYTAGMRCFACLRPFRGLPLLVGMLALGCGDDAVEHPAEDTTVRFDAPPPRVVVREAPLRLTNVTADLGLSTGSAPGVAFVDVDDNGWADLTVALEEGLRLFLGIGNGHFVDATERFGPALTTHTNSVVYADVDDDGDLDLYAGRGGEPDLIFENDGAAWFSARALPTPGPPNTQGVSFADFDGDGDLDAFVGSGRWPPPRRNAAGRPGLSGDFDRLLQNDGGVLVDVAAQMGIANAADSETFGGLWADFDRNGWVDLLATGARSGERYYLNQGGTLVLQTGSPWDTISSVKGLAVADVDGDGFLDVYAAESVPDIIYQGGPDGGFTWVQPMVADGFEDPTERMTSWGCVFADIDNDADPDVLVVSGEDLYFGDGVAREGAYALLTNDGTGKMAPVADGGSELQRRIDGQGVATADYDLDGDIDVAVGSISYEADGGVVVGSLILLRNDSADVVGRGFLLLDLRQPLPNAWAVGAEVQVTAAGRLAARVVTAGNSYLSAHDFRLHFGLGDAQSAKVVVRWPGGQVDTLADVPSGHWRIERRPGGGVERVPLAR